MRAREFIIEGLKNPKDNPCWKGYKPVGTKKKAGKTVPNCVPVNEGGWDTTLTQSTVLHPRVVGVALKIVDQFVNDFNRYLAAQGLGPIRRGRPTGSSAYHEIGRAHV